jgi:hypothetical protein
MKDSEVQNLINLRSFIIQQYNALDGRGEPAAVIKQQEVAGILETVVNTVDDLLKGYVKFE